MAAYDTLRAAIDSYIKANGNKEITGIILNDILNAMVSALGADTRFAGVAVPSTNPGNPEGNVVYFASQAGTYSNFGGIVLPLGIHILVWNGTAWTSQTWFSVDNTPTQNSQNFATSGGILQAIVDAVGVERLRAIGVEVTSASFDSNTKKITFFNSANSTLFQLDATAFVIDGMVSDVKIEDGNLVIQFNTDAGKQDIEIPLTDIFNPANYYTKTAIDALLTVINNKLADGCLYRGIAEPTTNPPTPTTKVFYIATKAGTYTNFGNIAVTEGITILKYDGSNWSKEQISYSDGVFDISAYNGISYADLSAALGTNGANIPQNLRKGGMSVKFVQSSDNKYVQCRLVKNQFSTELFDWVTDESVGIERKIGELKLYKGSRITGVGQPDSIYTPENFVTMLSVANNVYIKLKNDFRIRATIYYSDSGLIRADMTNGDNQVIKEKQTTDVGTNEITKVAFVFRRVSEDAAYVTDDIIDTFCILDDNIAERVEHLNREVSKENEQYTEVAVTANTEITKDVDCILEAGQIVEFSVTGNDGILFGREGIKYFVDLTNGNQHLPCEINYPGTGRITLEHDIYRLRFTCAGSKVLESGTITFGYKVSTLNERVDRLENTGEDLQEQIYNIEEELANSKYELPTYYHTNNYIENKIALINQYAKSCMANGDAFIFITDAHWDGRTGTTPWNAKKSPNLIYYISQNTNVPRLFDGGDTADAGSDDLCKLEREAFDREIHHAVGNHEFDPYWGTQTKEDGNGLYYKFDALNNNQIGDAYHHYYYVDNVQQKVRYIVLDTEGPAADGFGYIENGAQINWLRDVALNVESGWRIFIFGHSFYWIVNTPGETKDNVLKYHTSAAHFINDAIDTYNGNGEIVAIFQGHSHKDRVAYTPIKNIPVIFVTSDKYMTVPYDNAPDIDVTRTLGTTSEQAFDVVIADFENKTLHLVRIGAKARNGVENNLGTEVEERTVTWQ